MMVGIEALTRDLISQHDWIFPVVNGKRIGHEIDVAAVYLSHGIHVLQVHGTEILEVEIGVNSLESRENLHEKIRMLLEQPLIELLHEHTEPDLDQQ
nr:hypothetical protein [uncultured Tolumonas sp.]